jgi:hypothetical protein
MKDDLKEVLDEMKKDQEKHLLREPGYYSNSLITKRNSGIKHQFEDSIGGCSANYK